jgi:hypothetical protein
MVDLVLRRMRAHEIAEERAALIVWQATDYAIVDRDRLAGRQMVRRMRLDQRGGAAVWGWYMQAADVVPAGDFAGEYGEISPRAL